MVKATEVVLETSKKLKVFIPFLEEIKPEEYLENSPRFGRCNFLTLNEIQTFLDTYFHIKFEVVTRIDHENDLEYHDYVAFLLISDDIFRKEMDYFVKRGIPIVFVREHPKMECDLVKIKDKDGQCYKFRKECYENRTSHCATPPCFGEKWKFNGGNTLINETQSAFRRDEVPIFSIAFLIDFLIWFAAFGKTLRQNRDVRIRMEPLYAAMKAVADDIAAKITETT